MKHIKVLLTVRKEDLISMSSGIVQTDSRLLQHG